jgi:hypothetical protein
MARKVIKKGIIKYLCEKCGGKMFSVLKDTNDLIDNDNLSIFKKFLNDTDLSGPSYVCQFCKTIHKGYYVDHGFEIDFRPIRS